MITQERLPGNYEMNSQVNDFQQPGLVQVQRIGGQPIAPNIAKNSTDQSKIWPLEKNVFLSFLPVIKKSIDITNLQTKGCIFALHIVNSI